MWMLRRSFSEPLSAAEMIAVAAAISGYVNMCCVEEAEVTVVARKWLPQN
jgi:hypothetical protein